MIALVKLRICSTMVGDSCMTAVTAVSCIDRTRVSQTARRVWNYFTECDRLITFTILYKTSYVWYYEHIHHSRRSKSWIPKNRHLKIFGNVWIQGLHLDDDDRSELHLIWFASGWHLKLNYLGSGRCELEISCSSANVLQVHNTANWPTIIHFVRFALVRVGRRTTRGCRYTWRAIVLDQHIGSW